MAVSREPKPIGGERPNNLSTLPIARTPDQIVDSAITDIIRASALFDEAFLKLSPEIINRLDMPKRQGVITFRDMIRSTQESLETDLNYIRPLKK